jgi:hypothetical protein
MANIFLQFLGRQICSQNHFIDPCLPLTRSIVMTATRHSLTSLLRNAVYIYLGWKSFFFLTHQKLRHWDFLYFNSAVCFNFLLSEAQTKNALVTSPHPQIGNDCKPLREITLIRAVGACNVTILQFYNIQFHILYNFIMLCSTTEQMLALVFRVHTYLGR